MSQSFDTVVAAGSAVGEGEGATATKVVSSLSRKMAQPGGLSIAQIERRSNERLLGHKAEAMKAIERSVSELEVLANEDLQDSAAIYGVAGNVLSVAGFFDTGPLYDAVYSLCETIEAMNARNAWRNEAVHVHVQAIRLILKDNCLLTPNSERLMQGLKAIQAHAKGE